jgi:hypothetical protein
VGRGADAGLAICATGGCASATNGEPISTRHSSNWAAPSCASIACEKGYETISYSRQGMRLYFVGPYPFNLTRRTRRWEQKILFLCCSRADNLCRVFSDWLITRRRTTFVVGLVESIVGSAPRTRRLQTPYLCWILQLSSGSSGYMRRYERGCPGEIGRRRIRDGALEVLWLVGGWVGPEGRYLTHHCPSISTIVDMDFGEFHASSAHLGESSVRRYV